LGEAGGVERGDGKGKREIALPVPEKLSVLAVGL